MKTILVPLDLKANTAALLDYAVTVAAQNGASLLLLHVIRKQPYDNGTFDPDTEVHQRVRHEVQVILDQLARQTIVQGIRSRTAVTTGLPADEIIRYAREHRVEMIVLHRGCGDGTCTGGEVLRLASCPVLTWQRKSADAVAVPAQLVAAAA